MTYHARKLLRISGAIVMVTSLVACGYWSMTPEEKARWFIEEVSEELEFSNTQRQKLEHLVDTFMRSREEFNRERQEERKAVLEIVQAESFDQKRALEMVRKKTRTIDQQTPALLSAYAELHSTLSKEQRSRIHERLVEMFEYYDKRRGDF